MFACRSPGCVRRGARDLPAGGSRSRCRLVEDDGDGPRLHGSNRRTVRRRAVTRRSAPEVRPGALREGRRAVQLADSTGRDPTRYVVAEWKRREGIKIGYSTAREDGSPGATTTSIRPCSPQRGGARSCPASRSKERGAIVRGFIRERGSSFTAYWETKDPATGARRRRSPGRVRDEGEGAASLERRRRQGRRGGVAGRPADHGTGAARRPLATGAAGP